MEIYIINLIIIIVLGAVIFTTGTSKAKEKVFLALAFIPLFLTSALRDVSVGVDTWSYVEKYNKIASTPWSNVITIENTEIGYNFYCKLLSIFSKSPQLIIVANSFLVLILFFIFIYKNSDNKWLSVYLFFTLNYYINTMGETRQQIAMGIAYCAYPYIKQKKFLKYITIVVFASMFHTSILIFLPLYFLQYVNLNYKTVLMFMGFALISYVMFSVVMDVITILVPKYSGYFSYGSAWMDKKGMGRTFLIAFSILLFGIVFLYNLKSFDKDSNVIFFIAIICCMFYLMATKFYLMIRIGGLFSVFFVVFIPKVICSVKDAKLRAFLYAAVIPITFAHFILSALLTSMFSTIPYKFLFK